MLIRSLILALTLASCAQGPDSSSTKSNDYDPYSESRYICQGFEANASLLIIGGGFGGFRCYSAPSVEGEPQRFALVSLDYVVGSPGFVGQKFELVCEDRVVPDFPLSIHGHLGLTATVVTLHGRTDFSGSTLTNNVCAIDSSDADQNGIGLTLTAKAGMFIFLGLPNTGLKSPEGEEVRDELQRRQEELRQRYDEMRRRDENAK